MACLSLFLQEGKCSPVERAAMYGTRMHSNTQCAQCRCEWCHLEQTRLAASGLLCSTVWQLTHTRPQQA